MVDVEWNRHGEDKGKPTTPGSGLVESNKTTPVFKLSLSRQEGRLLQHATADKLLGTWGQLPELPCGCQRLS